MSVDKFEKLFEKGEIGKLSIKNRTAMAPMGLLAGKLIEPGGKIIYRRLGLIEPLELKKTIVEYVGRYYK